MNSREPAEEHHSPASASQLATSRTCVQLRRSNPDLNWTHSKYITFIRQPASTVTQSKSIASSFVRTREPTAWLGPLCTMGGWGTSKVCVVTRMIMVTSHQYIFCQFARYFLGVIENCLHGITQIFLGKSMASCNSDDVRLYDLKSCWIPWEWEGPSSTQLQTQLRSHFSEFSDISVSGEQAYQWPFEYRWVLTWRMKVEEQ